MKPIFLILLMSVSIGSFSQEPLTYSEVVEVSGVNKDELFVRGREWFNENFKSSKDVLQVTDKDNGELLGKGIMEVTYTYRYLGERTITSDVGFQMNVWVKDGKYKYEMTNFSDNSNFEIGLITTLDETHKTFPSVSAKKMNEIYVALKIGTKDKAADLIDNLKSGMSKKAKSSDW